ncbi:MAG: radical SAM protein, partial [Deltaproteobacteria bacterium]
KDGDSKVKSFQKDIFDAGIRRINVSLDSLNAKKYSKITGGGELQKVIEGIAEAQKIGIAPIKINVVAIKGFNDDEIIDFAHLAFSNPLQVRFIEFMPLGNTKMLNFGEFISNEDIQNKIATQYKLKEITKKHLSEGPARLFGIDGGLGLVGFISPLSHNFCNSCNRLRLTSNGYLRACLLNDEEVNIKNAIKDDGEQTALRQLIKDVISRKPKSHCVTANENNLRKKCHKEMFQIGG